MSKRGSENSQQRREDFEAEGDGDEDEPVNAGTFQKASADVLRTRRIISVSDRFKARAATAPPSAAPGPAVPAAATNSGADDELKAVLSAGVAAPEAPPPDPLTGSAASASAANPFASFTGLAPDPAKPAATETTAPSDPFAGFTALTSSSSSPNAGAAAANPFAGFTGLCAPKDAADEKPPAKAGGKKRDQSGEDGGDEKPDTKPDVTAAPEESVEP